MNTRSIAAKIIYKVIVQQESLDLALPLHCDKSISEKDRALIQEFCYGTLRWYPRLDFLAKTLLQKDAKKLDSLVYALLLVGLYQLIYLRIPDHAAISETVSAARVLKKNWATTLINAILRGFSRQKDNLLQQVEEHPIAKYAHPLWFIELVQQAWPKSWQTILDNNNAYPPMHLRVNLRDVTREAYLHKLSSVNIVAEASSITKAGIVLSSPTDVTKLPGFSKGMVSVQDLAAQLAAELLELKSGQRVLDACAAPGGKAAHILESGVQIAELVALDVNEERLVKVSANLQRLNLRAKLACGDVLKAQSWWDGKKFDRILLDAPCSATGVIRRHPDIKVLRQAKDIAELAAKQLKMLETLWELLADGGVLLYATCSVLPQENDEVVAQFLQKYSNAYVAAIDVSCGMQTNYGRQIFPMTNGPDGFYYAKIRKAMKN